MASEVVMDTVANTELTRSRIASRLIRTGYVKGLPLEGTNDSAACFKAELALDTGGYTINSPHPDDSGMYLSQRVIRPWSAKLAKVFLYYEIPNLGIAPSTWVIRDQTMLVNYRTDLIPGTRVPIRTGDYTMTGGRKLKGENVPMTFLRPMRQLYATKSVFGTTPDSFGYMVGVSNSDTYFGLPKGYWLCTASTTEIYPYSGRSTISASITSRVIEDWSETGILFNRLTKKKVPVSNADVVTMLSDPYARGIIYQDKGMVRVGPYPIASYSTAFG